MYSLVLSVLVNVLIAHFNLERVRQNSQFHTTNWSFPWFLQGSLFVQKLNFIKWTTDSSVTWNISHICHNLTIVMCVSYKLKGTLSEVLYFKRSTICLALWNSGFTFWIVTWEWRLKEKNPVSGLTIHPWIQNITQAFCN